MKRHYISLLMGTLLVAGCSQEPPARTVTEFVDNPLLLEAAVVRCAQDRTKMKYVQECINAREAVKIVEAREEAKGRADLEARSEQKRRELRRTQEAAAEARRRAEEAQRLREEAEYLAQFGVLPPADDESGDKLPAGNVPIAVVPKADSESPAPVGSGDTVPAFDGGNAPTAQPEPVEDPPEESSN
jgi:hypothetical protein